METRTVRLEPYYLENLEDDRLPNFVVECAALLNPGLTLDLRESEYLPDDSDPGVRRSRSRHGKDLGIEIDYYYKPQEQGMPVTGDSAGIEVSTFGLIEGRKATLRYTARWNKGNRSFMQLEVVGPDREAGKIEEQFRKQFAGPDDGDIKRLKKDMQEALKQMDWGTTQDFGSAILLWRPDDTETMQAMGSALLISRDIDGVERLMNRLLELKPDSYEAHLNLGNVWKDRQDYDKAIEHYTKMVELKPEESFATFILATAYEARGDKEGALKLYRQAAEMKNRPGPTDFNALAREAIEKLENQ